MRLEESASAGEEGPRRGLLSRLVGVKRPQRLSVQAESLGGLHLQWRNISYDVVTDGGTDTKEKRILFNVSAQAASNTLMAVMARAAMARVSSFTDRSRFL